MYTHTNYQTKKALKEAVASGKRVTVYSPGIGEPPHNGTCCVEGPHYPQPHRWYATVTIENGIVTKVR